MYYKFDKRNKLLFILNKMDYHISYIEETMHDVNYSNYCVESHHRNSVLSINHGKIPSYSLWNTNSISSETVMQRIDWWSNYIKSEDNIIKSLAQLWTEILTKKSD